MCCFRTEIWGKKFRFYGFQDVEQYLTNWSKLSGNDALKQWFSNLVNCKLPVLVINYSVENIEELANKLMDDNKIEKKNWENSKSIMQKTQSEDYKKDAITLAFQCNNVLWINFAEVKKIMDQRGEEYFLALIMHEVTHLMEEYLVGSGSSNICLSIESNQRTGYKETISLKSIFGNFLNYFMQLGDYQNSVCDEEGLTCLVEALVMMEMSNKPHFNSIKQELTDKLLKALEIMNKAGFRV